VGFLLAFHLLLQASNSHLVSLTRVFPLRRVRPASEHVNVEKQGREGCP
jgi:hypothetical protein